MVREKIKEGVLEYEYNQNNQVISQKDLVGTTTYAYDECGRVTKKSVSDIGETSYVYDKTKGCKKGHYIKQSTDSDGNVVKKEYDNCNRLLRVITKEGTTEYEYNPNGSRKSVTYPDGSKEEYRYDKNSVIIELVNYKADGKALDYYNYTYDNQNRMIKVEEPTGATTEYEYDANGNRTVSIRTEQVRGTDGKSTVRTTKNEYIYAVQNRLIEIRTSVNGNLQQRQSIPMTTMVIS